MTRTLITRIGQAIIAVVLVVTTCFFLIRLAPGDPFATVMENENVPSEVRERLKESFGYDAPIPLQYINFVRNAARGELGWSHSRVDKVSAVLGRTLPNTFLLMGTALLLGVGAGIAVGAWQGWKPESLPARATNRLGLVVISIPEFVLALLLLLGPALAWGWFPVGGMKSVVGYRGIYDILDRAHHLALPALTLALIVCAVIARHQRAAMLDVRNALFVRSARARGTGERRIFWRHALRNALVPVLTLIGVFFPTLFGGAVLVERIFLWPGMGSLMIDAVLARDYHLVTGGVLVSGVCVVVGTLLADLALLWADPRQRLP